MNNVCGRTRFYAGLYNHLQHLSVVLFLCIIVNFFDLTAGNHKSQLTSNLASTIAPTSGFGKTHFIAGFPREILQ